MKWMQCVLGFGLCLAATLPASAAYVQVDNFESRSLGALAGQGAWVGTGSAAQIAAQVVEPDPANASNKVLHRVGLGGVYIPINIPDATTATFYLRFRRSVATSDDVFGLSDVAAPTTLTDFSYFEAQSGINNTNLRARDAGVNNNLATLQDAWYSMWLVVNTTTDSWQGYLQSNDDPTYATQTQMSVSGDNTFTFRNGAATNPLVTLLIKASNGPTTSTFYDDVYLDLAGQNLTVPVVPEPASGVLLAIAGLASLRRRRR